MSAFTGILIGLLAAAFVGGVVYLMYYIFWGREPLRGPLLINFASKRSEGRALGVVSKVDKGTSDRQIIKLYALDIDPEKNEEVKEIPLVTSEYLTITLPRGTLSKDKDFIINLPASPSAIPEALKRTDFGTSLAMMINNQNFKKMYEEILREDGERKKKLLEEINRGEVSIEWMERQKELMAKFQRTIVENSLGQTKSRPSAPYAPENKGGL